MFPSHRWKFISVLLVKFDRVLVIQKRYLVSHKLLAVVTKLLKRLLFVKPRCIEKTMEEEGVSIKTKRLGFEMCKDSIGGVWSEIDEDQFQITRLRYGTQYMCYDSYLAVPTLQHPGVQRFLLLKRVVHAIPGCYSTYAMIWKTLSYLPHADVTVL